MKLRPLGIRGRLTVTYIAVFSIVLVSFGAISYNILKSRLDAALTQDLTDRAAAFRGYMHFDHGAVTLLYDPVDPEEAYFIRSSTRYYQIYNIATGEMLVQSPELDLLGLDLTPGEVKTIAEGEAVTEYQTDQGTLRFRNEVVTPKPGESYLLQIGASTTPMESALRQYFELLSWLIPLSIVIASTIGWLSAGRALRPMATLAVTARQIDVSDLHKRLPVRGAKDELDDVAIAFNDMFSRLAQTIGEMKQFTASISHELRTPLSVLRGEAEVALMQAESTEDYRRLIASQLEEFDKLTRMINQLLTLARAEAGEIPLEFKPVDLRELAAGVTEQMTLVAEARGVTLGIEADAAPVIVRADRSWLERVILNLIDNAIKFTPGGGTVLVSVKHNAVEGILEVRDSGAGIAAEDLPHIFERFYQADPARSGTGAGLGLSLVKWIVDQHLGSIDVRSQSGNGTTVCVKLRRIKTS